MPVAAALRRAGSAIAAIAAVAGLAAILEPAAYPSYDYAFAMASAQDLLAGRATGYATAVDSPVPHPLTLLEALAAVPLGDLAFPVFVVVALVALGVLCWSLFRIGSAAASWPAGLLGAALVFTSPAIFELAVRTYGDVLCAALIAAAIALEIGRSRRGAPVLALLALAGLLRPEAWVLAGAYWCYVAPSRPWRARIALAALAAAAPVIWMAMDTALSGDPLHAVAVTRAHAQLAYGSVSVGSLWRVVASLAGWPVVAGSAVGALLAWRRNRAVAAVLLLGGAAMMLVTAVPAALSGTLVLRRFLLLPACVMSVLFAIACVGATGVRSRGRRAAGIALAVGALVLVALPRAELWERHHERQAGRVMLLEQLRGWATAPPARAYLSDPVCWPVRTPGYGYRPYLRFWLDVPPRAVPYRFAGVADAPASGTFLLPTAIDGYQRIMLTDVGRMVRARLLRERGFADRFERVARSSRWDLYASTRCRRAVQDEGAPRRPAGRPV